MTPTKATPRLAPHDIEAEMAALGSMILGGSRTVAHIASKLVAADFYREAHGRIFEAMMHLHGKGEPVDVVTVKDELARRGALEQAGGYLYLIGLSEFVPTPANIEHYGKIVAEKSYRRALIDQASEVAALAYGDAGIPDLKVEAEKLARMKATSSGTRHKVSLLRDVLAEEFEQIDERFHLRRAGTQPQGIFTGLTELDGLLTGLKAGELHLVAARPGNGKSALAVTCAMEAAKRGPVLFVSLEMTRAQLAQRILAGESRVDSYAIRNGALDDREWQELSGALSRLWDLPFYVATVPAVRPSELRARCADVEGLSLVVVDYLQLMGSDERGGRREEDLAAISRALKELALELEIPVLALAQLNREVEKRPDKRPMLSDLRESGALEQDADCVWMLYRASYYAQEPADARLPDPTEVLIRKNRMGPIGVARVGFIAAETRFVNLATGGDTPW